MKKKLLLFLFLSVLFVTDGIAALRTQQEAQSMAAKFYQSSPSLKSTHGEKQLTLAYVCKDEVSTRSSSSTSNVYYYVFNAGENNGFVIVSGDDRAKDILGYSNSGSFDISNIPANFKGWLEFYQEELTYLMSQPKSENPLLTAELENKSAKTTYAASVNPLLGNIKWDQGDPYNALCPTIIYSGTSVKAPTGCVATGMAQVMMYHKWPNQGKGSNSYTYEIQVGSAPYPSFTFSESFEGVTYDWANMTETYGSSSSTAAKNAVAKLMYHCGISVSMSYDKTESGAFSSNIGIALRDNFQYNPNIQYYNRNYYSKSEWNDMVKTELNANRPVLYNGQSSGGGHLFVCDGYDTNGLFHINWGWSGSSNGYFQLSALNPPALGIGGGAGGGFNSSQGISVNVQKDAGTTKKTYVVAMDAPLTIPSPATVNLNTAFGVKINQTFNRGITTMPSPTLYTTLYSENDEELEDLSGVSFSELKPNYGVSSYTITGSKIPTSYSDGQYRLYLTYVDADGSTAKVRSKIGTPQYLKVTISGGKATFSYPSDALPVLSVVPETFEKVGNLYNNKTGKLKVKIKNTGEEFNSYLGVYIENADGTKYQIVGFNQVNIAKGEEKELEFEAKITLSAGSYTAYIAYDPSNNISTFVGNVNLMSPLDITIGAEPPAAIFSMAEKISCMDKDRVYKTSAEFVAKLKNTGGYGTGRFRMYIYTADRLTNLGFVQDQYVTLDQNESKDISFKGQINAEPGNYFALVFYLDEAAYMFKNYPVSTGLDFTLLEDVPVGIEQNTPSVTQAVLYPNPASDVINFNSTETVKVVRILDIFGKQVSIMKPNASGTVTIPIEKLSIGTYILQAETESGIIVDKFIKK